MDESGWINEEGARLVKEFSFKNFVEAMTFVNDVAQLAEGEGHHPDIYVHDYKHVRIILTTHSVGSVTDKDHILAGKINSLGLASV